MSVWDTCMFFVRYYIYMYMYIVFCDMFFCTYSTCTCSVQFKVLLDYEFNVNYTVALRIEFCFHTYTCTMYSTCN